MKATIKAFEFIGIMLFFIGGASMDSDSIIMPLVLAATGIILFFAGASAEGVQR